MVFKVKIKAGFKTVTITVVRTFLDDRIERFNIIGKDRTIELENDRPFWRNRGLKKRKPNWKLIKGEVLYGSPFDDLKEAILKEVDKDV